MSLDVEVIPQKYHHLGRQKVHDSRSKAFATGLVVDRSKWQSKTIRIYDPLINPNQCHGECTGVAKCVQFNAVGNRVSGVVLNMDNAHRFYTLATQRDPFEGSWPPDDTGSSGLASCKAATELGFGGAYSHVFNGADGVIQLIQQGRVVSCGTWWYDDMMMPNANGFIEPTGPKVGGHQYSARGYDLKRDAVLIRCWWGSFRDVWIKRTHLNELLLDGGDAHVQDRVKR